VGWATGFEFQLEAGIFLFITAPRPVVAPTQPPTPWLPGTLSLGAKQPAREADHSPKSIAEVKNAWIYIAVSPNVFMSWCLIKHRENLTFILIFCGGPLWHDISSDVNQYSSFGSTLLALTHTSFLT